MIYMKKREKLLPKMTNGRRIACSPALVTRGRTMEMRRSHQIWLVKAVKCVHTVVLSIVVSRRKKAVSFTRSMYEIVTRTAATIGMLLELSPFGHHLAFTDLKKAFTDLKKAFTVSRKSVAQSWILSKHVPLFLLSVNIISQVFASRFFLIQIMVSTFPSFC